MNYNVMIKILTIEIKNKVSSINYFNNLLFKVLNKP